MFSITQESKTLEIMKDTDLPELNLVQFTDEDIDKMRVHTYEYAI